MPLLQISGAVPPTFYVDFHSVLRHNFKDIMAQFKVQLRERSDSTVLGDQVGRTVLLSSGQLVTWG